MAQKAEQRAQSQEHNESEHYFQWEELLPNEETFPNLRVGSPENIYLTRFQNCYGSVSLSPYISPFLAQKSLL